MEQLALMMKKRGYPLALLVEHTFPGDDSSLLRAREFIDDRCSHLEIDICGEARLFKSAGVTVQVLDILIRGKKRHTGVSQWRELKRQLQDLSKSDSSARRERKKTAERSPVLVDEESDDESRIEGVKEECDESYFSGSDCSFSSDADVDGAEGSSGVEFQSRQTPSRQTPAKRRAQARKRKTPQSSKPRSKSRSRPVAPSTVQPRGKKRSLQTSNDTKRPSAKTPRMQPLSGRGRMTQNQSLEPAQAHQDLESILSQSSQQQQQSPAAACAAAAAPPETTHQKLMAARLRRQQDEMERAEKESSDKRHKMHMDNLKKRDEEMFEFLRKRDEDTKARNEEVMRIVTEGDKRRHRVELALARLDQRLRNDGTRREAARMKQQFPDDVREIENLVHQLP